VRVKKEPISPPKKPSKRSFADAIELSDDEKGDGEGVEDAEKADRASTSSSRTAAAIGTCRSTRQTSSLSKGSKKAQMETPLDDDLNAVLVTQYQAISEAFNVISKAISRAGKN
jgi:hypothetical protein